MEYVQGSRGDQILNAKSFKKQDFSYVLMEEDMNSTSLSSSINNVYNNKGFYIREMYSNNINNGIDSVIKVIKE